MQMAGNITVIPARRNVGARNRKVTIPKTRVAAYCRVSTEMEEQESSYTVQVEHYTNYIKSKAEWEFVKVYADDGISGTNTAKREAFNQMIEDCKAGKIDLILTKSISRFARNTVDCLKFTRELKSLNIAVFFEKENINTLDAKGEVLMTIMAALAQQESESLSANVRLGIQFRNQQGKVQVNHNWFLGYTKDENGKLVIVPEEAAVIRRIYAEYLDGSSFAQIKRSLEADGILNGAKHKKWQASNIKQILTNEKYIGDALLQKTYTASVLEKRRLKNDGVLPQYYVEGSQEPIIDKEVFLRVKAEMERRRKLGTLERRRVYSSRYALSGMVVCEHCGDSYRRIAWNNRGIHSIVWRCCTRVNKGGYKKCPSRTLQEEELHTAVVTAVNDAWVKKDSVLPVLKANIESVIDGGFRDKVQALDEQIKQKQIELLEAGRDETKISIIGEEIITLREEKQRLMTDEAAKQDQKEKLDDMMDFLNQQVVAITEYDDILVRRLIQKVTVCDKKMVFEFKSGLEIEVDA